MFTFFNFTVFCFHNLSELERKRKKLSESLIFIAACKTIALGSMCLSFLTLDHLLLFELMISIKQMLVFMSHHPQFN